MVDVALLVVGAKCAKSISNALSTASKLVNRRLYIRIDSNETSVRKILPQVYLEASRICDSLDVRVLLDEKSTKIRQFDQIFKEDSIRSDVGLSPLPSDHLRRPYRSVVLGGTFDRLHNGHKLLLSTAVLCASERIVCGVTYGEMVHKKCLWELMEPFEVRENAVREFIEDVSAHVRCEIHPIVDPFGPSIVDPDLQAIVVSDETVRGARAVNDLRKKGGLSTLAVERIELLEEGQDEVLCETKISSSARRRGVLGTIRRPLRVPKTSPFPRPFVIGLTGGIASGKSNAAKVLAKNGCQVIDCDKLAHELYQKGSPMAEKIRETFGDDVIEDGCVNRKALGKIVFADKDKLNLLNNIVWPSLRSRVDEMIKSSDAEFVVVDAAVLLEADWDINNLVHQVWTCFVPQDEAIRRVTERDGDTAEEAKRKLAMQMDNEERIKRSDVVICSLWKYEETARQLVNALNELRRMAENHSCSDQKNAN